MCGAVVRSNSKDCSPQKDLLIIAAETYDDDDCKSSFSKQLEVK